LRVELFTLPEQAQKGIVGRGVLLDYAKWAGENGLLYDAFTTHKVTVDDLLQVAASQSEFSGQSILGCSPSKPYRLDDKTSLSGRVTFSSFAMAGPSSMTSYQTIKRVPLVLAKFERLWGWKAATIRFVGFGTISSA
jgi:hypothetical protein